MKNQLHPLQIGSVTLPNNIALAPMAGTTDTVFRQICRRMKVGLTVTELVSARGIRHDSDFKRCWRYIAIDPAENPVAIQLFGSDPDDFAVALTAIFQHPILRQCALIDLNMGCPVTKVVRQGDGCALMREPLRAAKIVKTCVKLADEVHKPVTVKIRKGWDDKQVNAVEVALRCQDAGAAAVTVHGRTRDQMYTGKADWSILRDVKKALQVPVWGNGDVDSGCQARNMLDQTGVDGVMVGRAAQGNPWIFLEIERVLRSPHSAPQDDESPTPQQRVHIILEHLDGLAALYGMETALREMRGQVVQYLKGTRHAAHFKSLAVRADSRAALQSILEEWQFCHQKSCEVS